MIVKGINFENCSLIFGFGALFSVFTHRYILGKDRMWVKWDHFLPFSHLIPECIYRSGQYLVSRYDTAVPTGLNSRSKSVTLLAGL